jgi:peptidoglycan/xylan/chitin deacetylase (PgdA/CDA1 family)
MTVRQKLAYRLKRAVARALYITGVLQMWQTLALRRRAVVLMYHRVLSGEERARVGSHPALVVDRETFARQMALLKKRFTVLSVAEFADYLRQRKPFPPSCCLITFDDGWQDNFDNALPILARYQLPSLIFLPINYIGSDRVFWQESLVQLLRNAVATVRRNPESRAVFEPILAPVGLFDLLDDTEPDAPSRIIDAVSARKGLGREKLGQLVSALANATGTRLEDLARVDGFIDWAQVASMAEQGVTFGGHGVDHLLLTQVSEAQAQIEIDGSKAVLDLKLREPVPTFSYPNGYCTPRVVDLVKRAGFQLAFVALGGPVTADDDPWTLRRVNIHEAISDTEPLFLARLVGLF